MRNAYKFDRPINKTAALVTSQSGISEDTEYLKLKKQKENVMAALLAEEKRIRTLETKKQKREVAEHLDYLRSLLAPINKRLKELNLAKKISCDQFIIKECMSRFTEKEWKEITNLANEQFQKQYRSE